MRFQVGDLVVHDTYGVGLVIEESNRLKLGDRNNGCPQSKPMYRIRWSVVPQKPQKPLDRAVNWGGKLLNWSEWHGPECLTKVEKPI